MDSDASAPLLEGVYSRIQISKFLEATSPDELRSLEKIYLTCNPIDPNMGRNICFIGKTLPKSWNSEWEPCRNGVDPMRFVQDMKLECAKVQDHYERNIENYRDISTVEGQKRLAEETGALGSNFLLSYWNPRKELIFENLTKGWLALAKALNEGNFGVDKVISLSFALNFGETSRLKIGPTSIEMMREIGKIFKEQGLKFSIKIKTDVATHLSMQIRDMGPEVPRFDSPLKGKLARMDELEDMFKQMNVTWH